MRSISVNEWLDLKIKLEAAVARLAELEAEVELWTSGAYVSKNYELLQENNRLQAEVERLTAEIEHLEELLKMFHT